MPQIQSFLSGVATLLLVSFTPIILLIQHVQPGTLGGPFSEHGSLCNATWRPNLMSALQSCAAEKQNECAKGYRCAKTGFCCPEKETVCQMETDSGHESAVEPYRHNRRYAYNAAFGHCTIFSYFGVGGNFNNFKKFSECKKLCDGIGNS